MAPPNPCGCSQDAGPVQDLRPVGSGEGEHPICGDVVRIDLRMDDAGESVADLAWGAQGCPAVMAVAAASFHALRGVAPGEFAGALTRFLDRHGGLARHERHAAQVVLRAARAAAEGAAGGQP